MDAAKSITANFSDVAAPVVTITSPQSEVTQRESVILSGTATDNQQVATLTWELNGVPKGNLLFSDGQFSSSPINLALGANIFRVIATDAAGNQTIAEVTNTWEPSRIFALGAVADCQEGTLVTMPLTVTSQGDIGGMTLVVFYDTNWLTQATFEWSGELGYALSQVNYAEPGRIYATLSLASTPVAAGNQVLAQVSFRTRSVPAVQSTPVTLTAFDVTDVNGDILTYGTALIGSQVSISKRHYTGDNNANDRLDVGDATTIQRLIARLDEVRSWDIAGNDLNSSGTLDSGDVTKVLRTVVGLIPQPTTSGKISSKPSVSVSGEVAALIPSQLSGKPGDFVTMQVALQNISTPISGASFYLTYPTNAVRLLGAAAHKVGAMVPNNALVLWNIAPSQNNYATQSGTVALAISSATPWPSSNGILAELTFQVQPGYYQQESWPITLGNIEITENGFNNRLLKDTQCSFIGVTQVPFHLTATSASHTANGFTLTMDNGALIPFGVMASTNLIDWEWVMPVTNNWQQPLSFTDKDAPKYPARFYKLVK
jgi:hypothetical protein